MAEREPKIPPVGDLLGLPLPSEAPQPSNERGDLLDYYLGPTGIPDRLRVLNELFNPIAEPLEYAGYALREDLSPEQRREYAAYAASQAGIAALPGALYAKRLASLLRRMANPDPSGVTKGRAVVRRDNEVRGRDPATVSPLSEDVPFGVRKTKMDQLEDMIASGLVRPKIGGHKPKKGRLGSSQIYFGPLETRNPTGNALPDVGQPVALVGRRENLQAYEGGIPIDALERVLMRQDDGKIVDILDDILARNRSR